MKCLTGLDIKAAPAANAESKPQTDKRCDAGRTFGFVRRCKFLGLVSSLSLRSSLCKQSTSSRPERSVVERPPVFPLRLHRKSPARNKNADDAETLSAASAFPSPAATCSAPPCLHEDNPPGSTESRMDESAPSPCRPKPEAANPPASPSGWSRSPTSLPSAG